MAAQALAGKNAIVVGLGTSGISAAQLLLHLGASVTLTDSAELDRLAPKVKELPARLVAGGHEGVDFSAVDLVVVSPGVPDFAALRDAVAAGVEVIGDVELAARFARAPILAVGGTNGKSTATTLLGHMVESAYDRVFIGGNLGDPSCDAALQELDAIVLEVSSFQMERLRHFRPKVACLLNITEDHLDRYPSFADYAQAKGNCFAQQGPEDFAIYCTRDTRTLEQACRGKGKLISFGPGGDYFVDGQVVVEAASKERFDLSGADLYGQHNFENAACAIAMARAFGLGQEAICEGLRRFRALPHRMALSGKVRGIPFYDDSKATNVGSAEKALRGLTEQKGVLIAGGKDKFGDFKPLVEAIAERARAVVLLGEAADRLDAAIAGCVPTQRASSMQGAVLQAFQLAEPGDAVLLSPACSSFDMFKNYSDRGERFTQGVQDLPQLLKKEKR